jgi:hypothetical protein
VSYIKQIVIGFIGITAAVAVGSLFSTKQAPWSCQDEAAARLKPFRTDYRKMAQVACASGSASLDLKICLMGGVCPKP